MSQLSSKVVCRCRVCGEAKWKAFDKQKQKWVMYRCKHSLKLRCKRCGGKTSGSKWGRIPKCKMCDSKNNFFPVDKLTKHDLEAV